MRAPKTVLAKPILGVPTGMMLAGAAVCLTMGLVAAIALDKMTRTPGPVAAEREDVSAAPSATFQQPDTGLVLTSADSDAVPWIKHAAPFPARDPAPRLAIIVVESGADIGAARNALRIPAPLTFAIAPTANSADRTASAARSVGREVLLLLPMQSESHFDTNPNPIAINVPRPELLRRLSWNLAQIDGYVGVMNRFGEDTTRDPQTMRAIMEVVTARGLGFVDARAHPDSIAGTVARRMNVPAADSIVEVISGADAAELGAALATGVRHAERWGTAIVTVPAERKIISALAEWFETPQPEVKVAPVTAVIKRLRAGKS